MVLDRINSLKRCNPLHLSTPDNLIKSPPMKASSLALLLLPGALKRHLPGALLLALFFTMVTSSSAAPTVTNPVVSSLDSTSVVLTAIGTDLDGGRPLERGFVYAEAATNSDPLIGGTGVTKIAKSKGLGTFTASLADLAPATAYAVKSFTRTDLATAYSAVIFFTTDTSVEFTSGIGGVSARVITGGETQVFDFNIEDSSDVVFSSTGASGAMAWELRDALDVVVASGTGDLNFTGPLAWGDYQLRISNGSVSQETYDLDLDISTLADPRPDISVGLNSAATSGVDIYGPASLSQNASTTTTKALPRDFYFRVDNDGILPDSMRIYATPTNNLFRTTYWIGDRNQTAAMIVGVAGTIQIDSDDPSVLIRARVTPDRRNPRIRDRVVISGRSTIVYGSETFIGTMTVTASTDVTITDTARFQLDTLP